MKHAHHQHLGIAGLAVALLDNVLFALNVIAMKVVVDATSPLWSITARMGVAITAIVKDRPTKPTGSEI